MVFIAAGLGGTHGTEDAIANGDTRTISLYHTHTHESATVTYRRNGQYDPRALEQLNWLLRDWRRDEPTHMDPRLFDVLWEVTREVGTHEPIHVVSAYRSPETNAMLRRRSRVVAKHSQHMLGKAMDFYLPDVPVERVRAVGMRLQLGGVGYYPTAYTPFIHLDVGSVRAWPRMTRDQLVRLFPDGRTVHMPADGTPLPGYEEARAEVLARGGTVAGVTAVATAEESTSAPPRRRSLWAMLFGSSDEEEDAAQTAPARAGRAARPTELASAGEDESPAPSSLLDRRAAQAQERLGRPAATVALAEANAGAAAPPHGVIPSNEAAPAGLVQGSHAPDVPLPPLRLAGVEPEPRLVWQQGPGGQNPSFSGTTPMPPRRPEDLFAKVVATHVAAVDIEDTGALGYAPMPPVRPSTLAGSMPWPGDAKSGSSADGDTRFPTARVPLPPARPSAQPVEVASLVPVTLRAAPVAPVPAPPMPVPAGTAERAAGGPKEDRALLRMLFSAKSAQGMPPPAKRDRRAKSEEAKSPGTRSPDAPPASLMPADGPTLALGFSAGPAKDLPVGRFSGPAVKPLPILR